MERRNSARLDTALPQAPGARRRLHNSYQAFGGANAGRRGGIARPSEAPCCCGTDRPFLEVRSGGWRPGSQRLPCLRCPKVRRRSFRTVRCSVRRTAALCAPRTADIGDRGGRREFLRSNGPRATAKSTRSGRPVARGIHLRCPERVTGLDEAHATCLSEDVGPV
jgi:hypothetical protein